MLGVVLVAAFAVSKGCASSGTDYSSKQAVAIARKQLDFTPKCMQIRYLRTGLQSQPVWAVSLWTLDPKGRFDRIGVVVVSARTGKVLSLTRHASGQSTRPQCVSPV
jgi:hypothetical protein